MRRHLTNAGFGVLDYISYPVGMLLVAPVVLRKVGAAEYGLWMIATAVISAGGIIASGFCDACIQRVASMRGTGEYSRMPETIRSMLGINILLGSLLALGVWLAAPFAALHISVSQLAAPGECLISMRIASLAILIRPIESVAVGVQRAFEQYRGTVQISTAMRLVTLASAVVLALLGMRTVSILLATVVILAAGTLAQFRLLHRLMADTSFWPRFHMAETRILLSQGFFVWLQTLGGVAFWQLDRILLGVALGAAVVTPYALCVQFAHPLYGLTASGLNFLFPYLSTQASATSRAWLRRTVAKAFACNLILVVCGAGFLLAFGDRLIGIWAGRAVAQSTASILPPVVVGAALMGLSVTGTYAMQALGEFRTVATISLVGRAGMLLVMIEMLRHQGLQGLALSRLGYGSVALLVYLPLIQQLKAGKRMSSRVSSLTLPIEAREGLKP
jgi:O-antigen/teichoic acid export membrane protein